MRFLLYLLFPLLIHLNASAQIGGKSTYSFLNLTNSARVAALGGKNISVRDKDLSLVYHNPALLTGEMSNYMVLNYVNYFAGINYGYFSYAKNHKKLGPIAGGLHFINYGSFIGANPSGQIQGTFRAAEYSLNLSWSYPLNSRFTAGVTFKQIFSFLERYNSYGIAFDFGLNYYQEEKHISASLVLRNLGLQLNSYYQGAPNEPIPFEVLAGFTKKLEHAPFRFSLVLQHLENYNLHFEQNQISENLLNRTLPKSRIEMIGAEFLSHLIAGVEIIPIQNFF